ncbi:MAG: hypothetical protein JWM11_403 [Planctomycetaceae bacterium]|nr:hypothetical protein [Planctomycetaceae bacterium]
MITSNLIDDLYRHDIWANGRILQLAEGLTDEQLDEPREMGFGSLRATLFHILAAEEIWLERCEGQPWRPFSFEPQGTSLIQIGGRLRAVAQRRSELIDRERASQWQREVTFQDSKRNEYVQRLDNLLVHVANHGVHHRAQALHYLKQFGHTVPVGLDFLVFKLAYSNVTQDAAATEAMRQYGLEVDREPGLQVAFNPVEIQRLYAYHDWGNQRLLEVAATLDDAALDRDFGIGPGSIRKTFLHLFGTEPWWLKNWAGDLGMFEQPAADMPLQQLKESWSDVAQQRNAFISQLDQERASQIVSMLVGGPPLKFRIIDSLIQICLHGTHHRAQLTNMLRHSGVQPPGLDYVGWIRDSNPTR